MFVVEKFIADVAILRVWLRLSQLTRHVYIGDTFLEAIKAPPIATNTHQLSQAIVVLRIWFVHDSSQ